jgi:ribosome-associated translation inhibitor RaiA
MVCRRCHQFDSEKMLRVNFNAEVDDHEKDWSEVVVQQLSFAQTDQTIIVLHNLETRRRTSKGESLKTISHNFKTDEKFKAQCQTDDKMIVKIQVILQEKALKHQINALSAFQQTWDNLHHVICSSNYTQAQSRDIFTIISLDAVKIELMHWSSHHHREKQWSTVMSCHMKLTSYKGHQRQIKPLMHRDDMIISSQWWQWASSSSSDNLYKHTVDELVEKIETSALKTSNRRQDHHTLACYILWTEHHLK